MDDRAELIERLEKLSGPDREVDAALAIHFDEPHGYREDVHIESRSYTIIDEQAKRYTQSLDAAVALVEKVKPGWKKQILEGRSGNWIARVSSPRYETSSTDYMREREPDGSPNGAIALLIALLRSDKEAG